jgi:hypothetical protein
VEGFLQRDLQIVAQVRPALAPAGAARPAATVSEEVLEDVAHEVGEIGVEARPAGAAIGEGRMAEAVVGRPLLGVRQGLVRLVDLLELDLGVLVARVLVRVILHGELAESGFQLRLARGLLDP